MNDGTYLAVLDRFEGETGVLVLQEDDTDIADVAVEREELPQAGWHVDAVFEVTIVDDTLTDVVYLAEETESRQERAQSRFDRLSRRPPEDGTDDS
jgi:hypothetical protein